MNNNNSSNTIVDLMQQQQQQQQQQLLLPVGWTTAVDPVSGRLYYACPSTGESRWDPPTQWSQQIQQQQQHDPSVNAASYSANSMETYHCQQSQPQQQYIQPQNTQISLPMSTYPLNPTTSTSIEHERTTQTWNQQFLQHQHQNQIQEQHQIQQQQQLQLQPIFYPNSNPNSNYSSYNHQHDQHYHLPLHHSGAADFVTPPESVATAAAMANCNYHPLSSTTVFPTTSAAKGGQKQQQQELTGVFVPNNHVLTSTTQKITPITAAMIQHQPPQQQQFKSKQVFSGSGTVGDSLFLVVQARTLMDQMGNSRSVLHTTAGDDSSNEVTNNEGGGDESINKEMCNNNNNNNNTDGLHKETNVVEQQQSSTITEPSNNHGEMLKVMELSAFSAGQIADLYSIQHQYVMEHDENDNNKDDDDDNDDNDTTTTKDNNGSGITGNNTTQNSTILQRLYYAPINPYQLDIHSKRDLMEVGRIETRLHSLYEKLKSI